MKRGQTKKTSRDKSEKTGFDTGALLRWYDKNARILPWRARAPQKAKPYHVWLSEVMLQQTTVGAVVPYFHKFLSLWPTIQDLARADIDEVMTAWAGLGYYRRARALHETAQIVSSQFGGVFPSDEAVLRSLPGLGPYTTAAIAAIAFDQRANVVDGNIERVIARFFNVMIPLPQGKGEIRAKAASVLPPARFGDYAQALMDLGAGICMPRNPKCGLCPLARGCAVAFSPQAEDLPARGAPKQKPLKRTTAYFLEDEKGRIFLQKRPMKGLLAGMMEVPSSAWEEGAFESLAEAKAQAPIKASYKLLPGMVRHSFTHFDLEVQILAARVVSSRLSGGKWVAWRSLEDEALPSLMRKIVAYARRSREAK